MRQPDQPPSRHRPPRGPRHRAPAPARAGERGSGGGSSLAWTLLWPAVLLLILGGIQFAVHSFAQSLVLSAAQAGARAAAAYPASADRGQQAAETYLTGRAADSVHNPHVSVTMGGDSVTVTVTGSSQSLIPGWAFTVAQQAAAPLEQP